MSLSKKADQKVDLMLEIATNLRDIAEKLERSYNEKLTTNRFHKASLNKKDSPKSENH